jgi:hypothetical protein
MVLSLLRLWMARYKFRQDGSWRSLPNWRSQSVMLPGDGPVFVWVSRLDDQMLVPSELAKCGIAPALSLAQKVACALRREIKRPPWPLG